VTVVKLGEALVKDSLITREQLKTALERQVIFGGRIGTNIVELGILREKELGAFLSKFFRVPVADPALLTAIDAETIACIGREIAEKYKMVPFRKERNRLHAAMLDPRSMAAIDELRFVTGYDVIPYAVTELRLLHTLEKYYGVERDLRYISTFGNEEDEQPKVGSEDHREQMRKVKEQFANAKEREEIIGILLNESRKISSRAAVFILKGDHLKGWKGRGLDVDNANIAVLPNSLFSEVIGRKNHYRGPLLRIPENEPFISMLSGTPQDCLLIPVVIRDKIIALLYADNGNQAVMDASLNYIHTLVALSQLSFEIAILRKKIMDL
jgi:MshEN domain